MSDTYVLVHGAWHTGAELEATAAHLRAAGHTVHCPTLAGNRPGDDRSGVGLADAIDSLVGFLEAQSLTDVRLVGHSYGGMVISGAADRAASRIRRLVYVNAFIPDEGETVVQILDGSGSALAVEDPTTIFDFVAYPGAPEGVVEVFLKPDVVHASFAPDLSDADRWTIAASQRPASLIANVTPSGAAGRLQSARPGGDESATSGRTLPMVLPLRPFARVDAISVGVGASPRSSTLRATSTVSPTRDASTRPIPSTQYSSAL